MNKNEFIENNLPEFKTSFRESFLNAYLVKKDRTLYIMLYSVIAIVAFVYFIGYFTGKFIHYIYN
jgi:hypothetical protein